MCKRIFRKSLPLRSLPNPQGHSFASLANSAQGSKRLGEMMEKMPKAPGASFLL